MHRSGAGKRPGRGGKEGVHTPGLDLWAQIWGNFHMWDLHAFVPEASGRSQDPLGLPKTGLV